MSETANNGWFEVTVVGQSQNERISFRRSSEPGALVDVKLGDKTIQVWPGPLLAAAQLMQVKGDQ